MKQLTKLEAHLEVSQSAKQPVKERILYLLGREGVVPSFSEAAIKLCSLTQNENASLDDFGKVISMDAGLATRCIYVAGSVGFAARPIESIAQALTLIGVREIRRIAFAVATIDSFSHFRSNVDWKRFWLHNILVARLSERVTEIFRQPSGMEYLSGLLHDIGKLVLERYFPDEFNRCVVAAIQNHQRFHEVERELIGLDHCQIGAAVCECLQVHPHVTRAIRFHHEALDPDHVRDPLSDGGFLAAAVSLADTIAHKLVPYVAGGPKASEIESMPEWLFLQQLGGGAINDIDFEAELQQAEEDLDAFG